MPVSKGKLLFKLQSIPSVVYLFVFTLLVFAVLSPHFLSLINIANIILQSCMLIIVSLGMATVMLSNGIDLSAGSVMSLADSGRHRRGGCLRRRKRIHDFKSLSSAFYRYVRNAGSCRWAFTLFFRRRDSLLAGAGV